VGWPGASSLWSQDIPEQTWWHQLWGLWWGMVQRPTAEAGPKLQEAQEAKAAGSRGRVSSKAMR